MLTNSALQSACELRASAYAPAKINLCLRIVGRRDDGYHLLDSVALLVGIYDRLDIYLRPKEPSSITLRCAAAGVPADERNLAVRAARLYIERTRCTAGIAIDLEKRIPVGAGLGGGSSDAAATLVALNELNGCRVDPPDLISWGAEIGADVPFFVLGRPARMTGVGERLEPVELHTHRPAVIAFAGRGLATGDVYAKYDDLLTRSGAASSIRPPTSGQVPLREMLVNDLEAAALEVQPGLSSLKRQLLKLGAQGASMTGSGSAVFGLWANWDDARAAAEQLRNDGLWARAVGILPRRPCLLIEGVH